MTSHTAVLLNQDLMHELSGITQGKLNNKLLFTENAKWIMDECDQKLKLTKYHKIKNSHYKISLEQYFSTLNYSHHNRDITTIQLQHTQQSVSSWVNARCAEAHSLCCSFNKIFSYLLSRVQINEIFECFSQNKQGSRCAALNPGTSWLYL